MFLKNCFKGGFSLQEAVDLSVSTSVGQAAVCSLESVRHSEASVTFRCRPGLTPFSSAVHGLRSLSPCPFTLCARPLPLSHLMRWRTSEDSSVISPERSLRRQGRTSRSNSMMRIKAQTAIRAYEITQRRGSFGAPPEQLAATSAAEKGPAISDRAAPPFTADK